MPPPPQAFVRLSLGKEEIFFVATPNSEKQYSFELDVAESAKDFGQLSGTYLLVCVCIIAVAVLVCVCCSSSCVSMCVCCSSSCVSMCVCFSSSCVSMCVCVE